MAALLNAQNSTISFPLTSPQVIAEVNAALVRCDPRRIRDLGDELQAFNKAGRPLNTAAAVPDDPVPAH